MDDTNIHALAYIALLAVALVYMVARRWGGKTGRIVMRLITSMGLAGPWWVIILRILSEFFPQGWGVQTWWGRVLLPTTYIAAFVLCFYALGQHERKLAEKGRL